MTRLASFKQLVLFGLLAALPAALASGCKKSEAPAPAGSASAAPSAAAATPPPAGADPELWGQLTTIVANCKVNENEATSSCPKEEARKLADEFSSGRRSRAKALPTLARALASSDNKVRAVAAGLLHAGFRSNFGDAKPGDVKPEDAEALLKAVTPLPKSHVRRALPAAVHAAMLANRADALYAELDPEKQPDVAAIGYRYVMTHGRLAAFPKIQEIGKSKETRLALAAVESVQNMHEWTEEEQAAICPWATQFLADSRPSVSARAASALNNCGGKFLDEVLSSSELALKNNAFTSARLSGLRNLCSSTRKSQPNPPTDAQCERARSLLEKVVQAPKLEVSTRSSALVALTNQWSDARSLAFVKRLQQSNPEGLTEQLKTAVRRLERKEQAGSPALNPRLPRAAASAKTPG